MSRHVLMVFGALLLVIAGVAAGALAPGVVFAHAGYERSQPARDEVVPEPPAQVDVFFTEEVFKQEGRNFVRVFNDSAVQVSEGDGVVDDDDRTHISATLQPDLPPGRYIVRWMTTSDEDGDTEEGAFCFFVIVEPSVAQQDECAAFAEEEEETPGETATEPVAPTATAPGADATPEASPTAAADDEDDDGAPTAAIVGGVIGGAAVLAVVVVAGALWMRRRT